MKKTGLILTALLCAVMGWAANYGILVNGKMYFAADYKGPDAMGEGFDEYLAHVKVQSGDYCQLYDVDNKAAWAKPLNSYSTSGFSYDSINQRYHVTTTGCYDFYIKIKWMADELYIGPAGAGVVCTDGVDITKEDPTPSYQGAAPRECPDVMLQAFYWDSYQSPSAKDSKTTVYGRTKWIDHLNAANGTSAEEIGKWFDLVWLPPMSKASGGTGYHPVNYSSFDSDWGTETKLKELISVLHQNGARVVADIVINHADAQQGWCNFATYNFGSYGTFSPDASWICQTDEMNTSSAAGACKGTATGAADDGYGDEANYSASRDWDHSNSEVRDMFKAYLNWLRNDVHIDGYRYDYCKGFHNSHIYEYNQTTKPYFSVMEYWDGNPDELKSHLTDASWNTLTFDFTMKYNAFNNGLASSNYQALMNAGLRGANVPRYGVTFLDSHDTFLRMGGSEFCGDGNSMTQCRDKVLQCYAYMLSMPSVPCVFYPHWVTFKDEIKAMINARYKTGVHSESSVSEEAGTGYYKATITGTNGQIRLLLGPQSGYNSTPDGFTLVKKGDASKYEYYGIYIKMNTTRGDKDKNRQPIPEPQGVEEVKDNGQPKGEKFLQDGQLFIRCGEQVFDIMGHKVK